jgi:anti-anti-sigma regulatory factor
MLQQRSTNLLLGLDGLPIVDDAAISATIVALRRIRSIGGTVRLVTGKASHRQRLAQIGLDRVFDIIASPEEAYSRSAQPGGPFRFGELARALRTVAGSRLFASHRQVKQ